jgi:hypothetical protein
VCASWQPNCVVLVTGHTVQPGSPGQRVQIPGEGMPIYGNEIKHGDLFVTYTVQFPASLTAGKQRPSKNCCKRDPTCARVPEPLWIRACFDVSRTCTCWYHASFEERRVPDWDMARREIRYGLGLHSPMLLPLLARAC